MIKVKMINTWFISDTHFGHENILEYEKEARPFYSLEEMHEVMIDKWNSVVKDKDIVFHVGDFAFGRANISIASRLNGKKRLILGNHDTYPIAEYMPYFDRIFGMVHYKQCLLSHIPVHIGCLGSRWLLNIHGHLHSKVVLLPGLYSQLVWTNPEGIKSVFPERKADPNYFNVSCEQNDLTPIHFDIIMERLKEID